VVVVVLVVIAVVFLVRHLAVGHLLNQQSVSPQGLVM
jgi:hypothetical protein